MRIYILSVLLAFGALCSSSVGAQGLPPLSSIQYGGLVGDFDWAKHTLGVDDFIEKTQKPGAIILDLRGRVQFNRERIKGAQQFGADVTQEKLEAAVPSKDSVILVYCTNSLVQTRMLSLTDVVVPQIYALGYENVYMLEAASKHAAPYAGNEALLKDALNVVSR